MSEKVELDGDGVPLEAEGFSEKEKAANRPGETEQPKTPLEAAIDKATGYADSIKSKVASTGTLNRNWVEEAYKCFIKDAGGIDPTDPEKAIEVYFQKNATDELKARCKAEGKDAKGCWKFIEAVARKALGNRSGHIDPGVIYAIAMHWFEDVPKDWDKPAPSPKAKTAKPAKSAKPKKPKQQQGFFFEMLETTVEGGQEK